MFLLLLMVMIFVPSTEQQNMYRVRDTFEDDQYSKKIWVENGDWSVVNGSDLAPPDRGKVLSFTYTDATHAERHLQLKRVFTGYSNIYVKLEVLIKGSLADGELKRMKIELTDKNGAPLQTLKESQFTFWKNISAEASIIPNQEYSLRFTTVKVEPRYEVAISRLDIFFIGSEFEDTTSTTSGETTTATVQTTTANLTTITTDPTATATDSTVTGVSVSRFTTEATTGRSTSTDNPEINITQEPPEGYILLFFALLAANSALLLLILILVSLVLCLKRKQLKNKDVRKVGEPGEDPRRTEEGRRDEVYSDPEVTPYSSIAKIFPRLPISAPDSPGLYSVHSQH